MQSQVYKTYFVCGTLVLVGVGFGSVEVGCGGPPFEEQLFFDPSGADSGSVVTEVDSGPETASRIDSGDIDATPEAPGPVGDSGAVYEAANCPHDDGFGDVFYDCESDPLKLAYAACVAAGGNRDGGPIGAIPITCVNADPSPCTDRSGYVQMLDPDGGCVNRAWSWSGDLAGKAFTTCGCPSGPSTDWH